MIEHRLSPGAVATHPNLFGLENRQKRFGRAFGDCWWFARQPDGTVVQIGDGEINTRDLERIISELKSREVVIICQRQEPLIRREAPPLFQALLGGRARITREEIERYATFVLDDRSGYVIRGPGLWVESEIFSTVEREQLPELLNHLDIR